MAVCPYCSSENLEGVDVCEDCQQPIGFLTKPQAQSSLERSLHKDRVSMLAPRRPVVVSPDITVADVLDLLVSNSIGCVVVVDAGEIVGIFSERDALKRLNTEAGELADRRIADFMTPSPETCERDAKIAFALHKMDVGGYRHLPITQRGKICGVISIRDILDYVTANLLASVD